MNNSLLLTLSSFFILVFLQVLLFNNMYVFGFINPMIYLLFLVTYRFNGNQTFFILTSFLLGFCIDFLSQAGGAHSIATLSIAYLRPQIIRYAFGVTSEIPTSFANDTRSTNKFLFLSILIGLHHLLYYIVVYFNWDAFYLILKYGFLNSVFSLLLITLISSFYKK